MDNWVIRARKELTALGIVEDSGKRRRARNGELQIVWRISRLGYLVEDLRRIHGLTFEQAVEVARRGLVPSHEGGPSQIAGSPIR